MLNDASKIMTIPRLSSRLESMLYRRNVELEIAEIRPELNILHNAASELRKSERFKSVLQVSNSRVSEAMFL